MTRVTSGGGIFGNPLWSPDGRYFGLRVVSAGCFWTRADGACSRRCSCRSKSIQYPTSFTSDGNRLAYMQFDGLPQIWTVPLEDIGGALKAGNPQRLMHARRRPDTDAVFSPDGRWIAYASNESGRFEVYVRPSDAAASAGAGRWLMSNGGGSSPAGRRMAASCCIGPATRSWRSAYSVNGSAFVAGKPRRLGARRARDRRIRSRTGRQTRGRSDADRGARGVEAGAHRRLRAEFLRGASPARARRHRGKMRSALPRAERVGTLAARVLLSTRLRVYALRPLLHVVGFRRQPYYVGHYDALAFPRRRWRY